jgi:hypothetical protein
MRNLTLAILISLISALPAAAGECSDSSLTSRQVGPDAYDPAGLTDAIVQIALRLTEDCELTSATLAPRTEATFVLRGPRETLKSRRLSSNLLQNANQNRAILSRAALDKLESGEEVTIDLLEVRAGQFAPPGAYTLEIDVELGDQKAGVTPLAVQVQPAMQLVGEGAAGVLDVDLGDVRDGGEAERTLRLRTNTRLAVQIASEHGGLRHLADPSLPLIPYSLLLNRSRVDPGSLTPLKSAGVSAQLVPTTIAVIVQPAVNAFGGRYTDILTLSFVAD